jgi:hypothetical protein
MDITIKVVQSNQELKQFIEFPNRLYKNNEYFVPALFRHELKTLSKKDNPAFEFCEARYWLAYRNNDLVGRIAGIINHNYNKKIGEKCARFGWLDFTEDEEVLQKLMQTVENWAIQKEAACVHGPLGFISFDPSGVLVEGFNELPTSFGHYNFPYYPEFIERQGYKKDIDWLEYNVRVPEKVPDNFAKTAKIIKKRYNLQSVELNNKKDLMNYADAIFQLINREYTDLYSFSELTDSQIEQLKKQFIPMIRLEYVSLVVNSDNEVIGLGLCMPSLAKALKKARGKLYPLGIFRILRALRNNDTVDTLLIAVDKQYQDKGVNAIIFDDIGNAFIKNGITNIESNRELESNYSVNNLWKKFDYRQHKRARCYCKYL